MGQMEAEIQPIIWACIFLVEGEPSSYHKGTLPRGLQMGLFLNHTAALYGLGQVLDLELKAECKRGKSKQQEAPLSQAPQLCHYAAFHLCTYFDLHT